MKKRIINLLLCAVVLIGLLPTSALAAIITTIGENDQVVKNMQDWTDTTGFRYLYFVYATTDAYYAVLSQVEAPENCSATTLTMPDTLPFDAANESTSTQVPVRVINNLFQNASWPETLTSVTLPSKVEIIAAGFSLSKLTGITFPSTLKRIEDGAFWASSLTSVTFPDSLESIGASAFYGSKLESVTFGARLTTLGAGAFADCHALRTVDLTKVTKLAEIPANAFKGCALTSVTIPDCVTAIGDSAFYAQGAAYNELSGTALTSLDLGSREESDLQTIGAYAFGGNSGLTGTLTLPDSVSTIGAGAFSSCGFTDIEWPQNNEYFIEVNGFEDCDSLPGSVVENLPISVITIGERAFALCDGMREVTIPYSVSTIGREAFYRSGVSSLTIAPGAGGLAIHKGAFLGCTGLLGKTIDLPARVTQLYSGAFGQIIEGASDPTLTVYIRNANMEFAALDTTGDYPSGQYDYSYCPKDKDTAEDANWVSNVADPFGECVKLELHAPANCSAVTTYKTARDESSFQSKEIYRLLTRSVAFQEIAASADPVYHTVTTLPQDGVTFTVKQEGATLVPDSNGEIRAEQGKDVVVIAHKEGYYDRTMVIPGAGFTRDWEVNFDSDGWVTLPVSGKLLVNISKDGLALGSFEGLTLALKNGGSDVPFTASCPYLVLPENHGLNADDTLTLTVTPEDSMHLTGGTDTATLQKGSFTVALKSWGKAAVTATSTPAAPCVVILFDGDNAVSRGTTSNGVFTSDPLPAGNYTAVAYETNDYFGAVGSKMALSALGLTAGDYAEGSVTIADGETAALTLTVPKLDTGNLTSILDTNKCSLVFRSNRAVTDHPFDMQVNYALKPGYTAEKITFTLPSGVSIQSVYNERGELTVDGTNSVTVNNASGTLYVSLVCDGTGVKSIGASVTTTGGTTLPLGSGTVTAQRIFLDAAESHTAKRNGNRAEVFTTPNTPVSMTISGVEVATGTTNAAGRLALTYNLPEKATHGQSYTLTATANAENGGSASTSVTYFPAKAKLQWFGFRHYGYDITIIDNLYPDKEDTYYTYYAFGDEKSKYFSLRARFESDENLDVTVTVTMQDGSVHSVPMGLIDERENGIQEYGGELYLEGNTKNHVFYEGSIPVGFEIDWDDPSTPGPDGNLIYGQALEKAKARKAERDEYRNEIKSYPVLTPGSLGSHLESLYQKITIPEKLDKEEEEANIQASIEAAKTLFVAVFGNSFTLNLFNYGYRVSDTDLFQVMTDSQYNEMVTLINGINESEMTGDQKTEGIEALGALRDLEAECFGDVSALEAEIDAIAQQITDGLGLKEPIQEYDGWEEVLEEKGVTYEEGNYDPVQLEADGYTRMENEAGDCWVKENGTEQSFVWPNGIDTGEGGSEQPSGNGFQMTMDSAMQSVEGNWKDWSRTATADTLGVVGSRAVDKANKLLDRVDTARSKIFEKFPGTDDKSYQLRKRYRARLDKVEAGATAQLNSGMKYKNMGRGLSGFNIVNDGNQVCECEVTIAEVEAKRSELELLKDYAEKNFSFDCWDALWEERNAYDELLSMLARKKSHLLFNVVVGTTFLIADVASVGGADYVNIAYDVGSGATMGVRDFNIAQIQKKIERLEAKRLSICGDDWRKMPRRNLTPILDPSGIVYEAVESNVLSGVTATIYDVNSGETLWDAGAYDQTNPLTTGADGGYAWDVPTGTWQVKFTKDGYSTAQTASLAVPPPRMNLKTEMVSTAAPTVVSAAAYPDYVELVFSQYMRVTDELTVPEGYTYEWVNKDKVNAESSTEYSKVLHLKKSAAVGETVTVTLSGAKNYAGTDLAAYSSGALTVAVEPVELRLNYETQIAVLVGEAKDPRVTVQVLDAGGQPIPGLTVTAAIEDTAYAEVTTVKGNTGEDGVAVFSVKGLLPGWTEATFAVEGSSLTKTMPVRVTIDSNQVAKPVASIGGNDYTTSTNSITVPRGSALTLTCATEDAVIYYTTNDTCPCQAMDRQLYTGPITVNEDTYFRIAAYKEGMEYSERLNLKVSVSESSSGGGGGGGYTPGYSVAVEQPENGSVTISPKSASKGDIVTVTVIPDKGYTLETLTVTDKNGDELKLTEKDDQYTFTMPASKVTVKATFMEDNSMLNFFVDVPADAYYYDAVLWAAKNGITSGTSATTFSPNADCTRAQIVTFLWRAAGSPAPKSNENPFTDMKADAYYYDAVLWAVEQGITSGTGGGKFSPEAVCTRSQSVTFLYRAAGSPKVSGNASFSDVTAGSYYADAVAWAEQNGVTGGLGGGLFGSANDCTRGQIVTFLYRFFVK